MRWDADKRLVLPNTPEGEWRKLFGSVGLPDRIAELVITLNADGQTKDMKQAWFNDVRVARFGP